MQTIYVKEKVNTRVIYYVVKGTVMQIEKALTNDRLRFKSILKISHSIYNFAVIYPLKLLFS